MNSAHAQSHIVHVSRLRLIRFIGACIFFLSAVFLLLGGIFCSFAFGPIIHYVMAQRAKTEATSNVTLEPSGLLGFLGEFHGFFQDSVAVAVFIGLVGFCIWFIPYRRLARATWLCPSCHYDLSGVPCPKCDAPDAAERAAEHADATP